MTKKKITVVFYGVDSCHRPVFKADGYKNCYIGDTDNLFRWGASEDEIIEFYKDRDLNNHLIYFGNEFDCEPDGTRFNCDIELRRAKEA